MPRWPFAALAALTALAAACGDDGPSPHATGAGGAGGVGPTGSSSENGGDGGLGPGGAGGAPPACATCAQVFLGVDPAALCDGGEPSSVDLYDALKQCFCAQVCPTECASSLCIGQPPSAECSACADPLNIEKKCPQEVTACVNDK